MIELILIICGISFIVCSIVIAKNLNTYLCQDKIDKAIHEYKLMCIRNSDWDALHYVEYEDEENYIKTFWRLWDWVYTRILPKDKFEIIKPYIK